MPQLKMETLPARSLLISGSSRAAPSGRSWPRARLGSFNEFCAIAMSARGRYPRAPHTNTCGQNQTLRVVFPEFAPTPAQVELQSGFRPVRPIGRNQAFTSAFGGKLNQDCRGREALEHLPTLRRCRHVSLLLLFISELIRLGLGARFGPPMI